MRKTNKRKILLFLMLSISLTLQAADTEEETTESQAETPVTSFTGTINRVTPSSDGERVVPASQQKRMEALVEQLSQNHSHEIQTLTFNGENFLALFRDDATGDPQGCIILLHGDTEHPDWPSVIHPVRTKLNENSWCTLSIEMPDVLPKETISSIESTDEQQTANQDQIETLPNEETVFGRIDAAIAFLQARNFTTFAILGHRTGASYAIKYAAEKELSSGALILIAPISTYDIDSFDMSSYISQIKLPILDYYFDDSEKEVRFAQERQNRANQREDKTLVYQQIRALPNQRYEAAGIKRLTQRIWGFLKQNTPQKKQQKALPKVDKGLFHKTDF